MIPKLADYPRLLTVKPLEYDWDGFSSVTAFATQDDFQTVQVWFLAYKSKFWEGQSEEGRLELYFVNDRDESVASVLVVNLSITNTMDCLQAYIGSTVLAEVAETRDARCVGVFFAH
mgnify:CR=1 FL=1